MCWSMQKVSRADGERCRGKKGSPSIDNGRVKTLGQENTIAYLMEFAN